MGRIVDPQTGNLPVRVRLHNPDGQIAVGQIVEVEIVTNELPAALAVPAAAVFDVGEGPRVAVVREGKIKQLEPASVDSHGAWTIVNGTDLQPGEAVVVDGGFNLPDDTPVRSDAAEADSGATQRSGEDAS